MYFASPLIWECRGGVRNAGCDAECPYQYPMVCQRKIWPSNLDERNSPRKDWTSTVQKFSSCSLTKPEDSLMAGIARTLSPRMHSEYVAGLWRGSLAIDRPWASGDWRLLGDGPPLGQSFIARSIEVSTLHSANTSSSLLRECGCYTAAPTWSWASVDGPVFWKCPIVSDQEFKLKFDNINAKPRDGDFFVKSKLLTSISRE